ncbi:hypothetical protein [Bradyrhizobium sp. AZCC 2176]|uniref:hypothetical protein n=1 Tax=Bradyrhizobium sp. AZCC 2176 TaxID=3117025 RepID=UPI002FF2F9CA
MAIGEGSAGFLAEFCMQDHHDQDGTVEADRAKGPSPRNGMVGMTKFISVNLQENLLRQLVRDDFFETKALKYSPLNIDCRSGCEY